MQTYTSNSQETKLYLAYGSNLNITQMAGRCPTAKVVGAVTLSDYHLLFRGGDCSSVATIEAFKGGKVPVLVWEITPEDESALDHYEGFPELYRKETMSVRFDDKSQISKKFQERYTTDQPYNAMIYIMNVKSSNGHTRLLGRPGEHYFDVIAEGYRQLLLQFGFLQFDEGILDKAVYDSTLSNRKHAETIKSQILAIRSGGETNMLDTNAVHRIASREGYIELEMFLADRRGQSAYARFIFTGDMSHLLG